MTSKEFEEKYVRMAPRLYQVAYGLLHNQQDAEDVVQETLVKLWHEADRLERMGNPSGYVLRILKNASIDLLRLRPNEIELEPLEEVIAEPDLSPHKETQDKVKTILQSLPMKAQQIITMRHVAECSIDEICEVTGETPVNVRQILSRTRKKIVEQFKRLIL